MSWQQNSLALLGNGLEWQRLGDIFNKVEFDIPPHHALRYLVSRKYKRLETYPIDLARWLLFTGHIRNKIDRRPRSGRLTRAYQRDDLVRLKREDVKPELLLLLPPPVVKAKFVRPPLEIPDVIYLDGPVEVKQRRKKRKPKLSSYERRGASTNGVVTKAVVPAPTPAVIRKSTAPTVVAKSVPKPAPKRIVKPEPPRPRVFRPDGLWQSLEDSWRYFEFELSEYCSNQTKLHKIMRKAFDIGCISEHERIIISGILETDLLNDVARLDVIMGERAKLWATRELSPNNLRRWEHHVVEAYAWGAVTVLSFCAQGFAKKIIPELKQIISKLQKIKPKPQPKQGFFRRTIGRYMAPTRGNRGAGGWKFKGW